MEALTGSCRKERNVSEALLNVLTRAERDARLSLGHQERPNCSVRNTTQDLIFISSEVGIVVQYHI
jgi:hypothetical protein